ncbi:hypothetical protein ACA910_011477 [Epithemia clementina (nom. ined.)]
MFPNTRPAAAIMIFFPTSRHATRSFQQRLLANSSTTTGTGGRRRCFQSTSTTTTSIPLNQTTTRGAQPSKQQDYSCQRRSFTSLNQDTPYQLCFLRHGQSTWNRDNRFIGWTDTPLTDEGVLEARVAGQMLYQSGLRFDQVHTSLLRRSIRTANLVLMELGQEYLPVYKHWRLNERNYGALVGLDKKQVVQEYGKQQVKEWRRSYNIPPPPMDDNHPYHPAKDPRYRMMLNEIPKSESLKDTLARSSVYWNEVLVPALQEHQSLLIIGHENNLRSLLMQLEGISPDAIIDLNLPRAVPLAYRLDLNTMTPLDRPDGKLDEATGMLRGEWIGGDSAVSQILERDYKQVYDTSVKVNLETHNSDRRQQWRTWMQSVVGHAPPSPEAKAKAADSDTCPTSSSVEAPRHPLGLNDQQRKQEEQRGFFPSTLVAPPVLGTKIDHHYSELKQNGIMHHQQQNGYKKSNSLMNLNGQSNDQSATTQASKTVSAM